MIIAGIDPGVNTGYALWDSSARKLIRCTSYKIHVAMEKIIIDAPALVIFEDARKRRVFTRADADQARYGAAIREGVGSVKRDCSIWEDYLEDLGMKFIGRIPVATKFNAQLFQRATGWSERTNEHARDAGMIVQGMNDRMIQGLLEGSTTLMRISNRNRAGQAAVKMRHGRLGPN